jgi:phosphoglycolate phosphatase
MIRKTDSVILDVDGTLWDSTEIVAGAWNRALRQSGQQHAPITSGQLKEQFGKPMDVIAASLFPELTREGQQAILDLCCVYEHEALEEDTGRIWYPQVEETIRTMAQYVPVFIVSNCQAGYIELFLKKTGLGPYVKDIECFGNNGNSKAENIRLLASRNQLQHPIYVGDTQGDCDASDEAGVPFVWASYGFGRADHMDAQIHAFSDLLHIVEDSRECTE